MPAQTITRANSLKSVSHSLSPFIAICMYTHTSINCLFILICIYIHIHTYTYICVYTHTHPINCLLWRTLIPLRSGLWPLITIPLFLNGRLRGPFCSFVSFFPRGNHPDEQDSMLPSPISSFYNGTRGPIRYHVLSQPNAVQQELS